MGFCKGEIYILSIYSVWKRFIVAFAYLSVLFKQM